METGGVRVCADPTTASAGAACCSEEGTELVGTCGHVGERLTFAAAESKCTELGLSVCSARGTIANDTCGYNEIHSWLQAECTVQVQVHTDARVSLIHVNSD